MVNLYDLTYGNYRVVRAVTYPDFPESALAFDVDVTATDPVTWETQITVHGTYEGPTDVVRTDDYQLRWLVAGNRLLETGTATLLLASGDAIRQRWASIITPRGPEQEQVRGMQRFPLQGQRVTATISPFSIEDQRMRYEWEGTVEMLTTEAM